MYLFQIVGIKYRRDAVFPLVPNCGPPYTDEGKYNGCFLSKRQNSGENRARGKEEKKEREVAGTRVNCRVAGSRENTPGTPVNPCARTYIHTYIGERV